MALIDEVSTALQSLEYQFDVQMDGIQHGHRITVREGRLDAILDVFENTGTIRTGGKESALKTRLEDFVASYKSDPNFLQVCISAASNLREGETSASKLIRYRSCLFVLDNSKHETFRASLRAKGLKEEDTALISEDLVVYVNDERVIAEGVAEAVSTVQEILTNLGARFEEGAETPYKDRIPRVAARWSPGIVAISDQRAREILGRDLFDFLQAHDRRAFTASILILEVGLPLPDYSPVAMPIGRAFEGFVGKILLRLGLVTEVTLSDPEFRFPPIFDSKDAKKFTDRETSHKAMLDAMRQRIKEFRHLRLHSQSSRTIQSGLEDVTRYRDRVVSDMQEYYRYFKNFFAS